MSPQVEHVVGTVSVEVAEIKNWREIVPHSGLCATRDYTFGRTLKTARTMSAVVTAALFRPRVSEVDWGPLPQAPGTRAGSSPDQKH